MPHGGSSRIFSTISTGTYIIPSCLERSFLKSGFSGWLLDHFWRSAALGSGFEFGLNVLHGQGVLWALVMGDMTEYKTSMAPVQFVSISKCSQPSLYGWSIKLGTYSNTIVILENRRRKRWWCWCWWKIIISTRSTSRTGSLNNRKPSVSIMFSLVLCIRKQTSKTHK